MRIAGSLSIFLAVGALSGCSSAHSAPLDLGPNVGTGGMGTAGTGTGGMGAVTPSTVAQTAGVMGLCATYPTTSVAAMRNPATPGCYELSHVGLVARTDSKTDPRIYVQDIKTGDYSAILAKCSASAMHACAAPVAAKIQTLYDTFTDAEEISVRGYYQYLAATGFEQFYIEDVLDEGKKIKRPEPITLTVADIKRDARVPAKWFQRANVAIPAQDPLVLYDFSPADLMLGLSTACPEFAGFGVIPQSAGVPAAVGCSGMTNPAARASDPNEILIGRHFFNQLLFSTDCACAPLKNQMLLTPANKVSGTVRGYVILEQDMGGTEGYQVFEAAADQTFLFK